LWDLPPSETFELNRAIYGVPRAEYRRTLDELVQLLKLEPLLGKPVRQLSLGERMKCELCAALLHRPKVLFLDEPTIGLDVTMQTTVREFIRRYNEENGATVILTSHYMEDVAALCPRVIVIDHGRIVWDGALSELVHKLHPEKRVTLKFSRDVELERLTRFGARLVDPNGTPRSLDQQPPAGSAQEARLQVSQARLSECIAALLAELPVLDLTVEDPPLEEVLSDLFEQGVV
jgi:ABC-2 type transport system ATP-binding protein